jgi:two-component system chemotaxis response regulator CheB
MFAGMPQNAINRVEVDQILPLAKIPAALAELANIPVLEDRTESIPKEVAFEANMAEIDIDAIEDAKRPGRESGFACPSCHGPLWELDEGEFLRYRCRVGHAWSETSLVAEQTDAVEEALWVAFKALEERAALALKLADRARDRNQTRTVARFESEAKDFKQHAESIRSVLLKDPIEAPLSIEQIDDRKAI